MVSEIVEELDKLFDCGVTLYANADHEYGREWKLRAMIELNKKYTFEFEYNENTLSRIESMHGWERHKEIRDNVLFIYREIINSLLKNERVSRLLYSILIK